MAEQGSNVYREGGTVGNRATVSPNGGATVERPRLFSGIMQSDYARIAGVARVKEFAAGEVLYIEGEAVKEVLLITSGLVKLNKHGMNGAEVILRLGAAGDLLGAIGVFSTGTHCTTAEAFRTCRTLAWDMATFKSLMLRYPVLHQNMVQILGEYLHELESRFSEIATERVEPRVARQLMRLMEQIGQVVGGAVEIRLSREQVAQMTGTTLFTVSRLLSAWEARGVVKPRRESVTICDVKSLRAICQDAAA